MKNKLQAIIRKKMHCNDPISLAWPWEEVFVQILTAVIESFPATQQAKIKAALEATEQEQ